MSGNPNDFTHQDLKQRDLMARFKIPGIKYKQREQKNTPKYFKGLDTSLFRQNMQIFDQIQFVSRFQWHNLPEGITSEDIERLLYFRGQGMLYLDTTLGKFFFLPYAMTGDIIPGEASSGAGINLDFTGKFRKIKPQSFNGEASADRSSTQNRQLSPDEKNREVYLGLIVKYNITDVPVLADLDDKQIENLVINGAVTFHDYTPALSQTITSRSRLSGAFIEQMEAVMVNVKAAILNSTGFQMFALDNPELAELMQMQLDAITEDRHKGQVAAAVSAQLGNAKNIQTNTPAAISDFFNAMEQWNIWRQTMQGIEVGTQPNGTQYNNIAEITMGASATRQIYLNCFFERVRSAAIANAIWGTDIYPDPVLLTGMSFGLNTMTGATVAQPTAPGATIPAMEGDTEGGD